MEKPATARNLIESWCKAYKKTPKALKHDDYRRIVSWTLQVGYDAGLKAKVKPSKDSIANEVEQAEA